MKSFSPIETFARNLSYLRSSKEMSQAELGELVGASQKTILRYESGLYNPKMDLVAALADALDVKIEDFFNEDLKKESMFNVEFNVIGISNSVRVNYREEGKISDDLKYLIKEVTVDRLVKYHELYDLLNFELKFVNPLESFKTVKSRKDAEKAASRVRKKWNLGDTPILSVVSTLENHGINVVEVSAPTEFEGLSAYINEIPIVVLNNEVTENTRKRFTALHELGHLILEIGDDLSYSEIERICDAFAAAMLLPKELLIVELGRKRTRISKKELKTLKQKYGISVRSLLVGAAYSEIIEWDEYHEMKDTLIDLGKYEGEERATKYDQLVYRGIAEGQLSPGKAKYFSGIGKSLYDTIKNDLEFG